MIKTVHHKRASVLVYPNIKGRRPITRVHSTTHRLHPILTFAQKEPSAKSMLLTIVKQLTLWNIPGLLCIIWPFIIACIISPSVAHTTAMASEGYRLLDPKYCIPFQWKNNTKKTCAFFLTAYHGSHIFIPYIRPAQELFDKDFAISDALSRRPCMPIAIQTQWYPPRVVEDPCPAYLYKNQLYRYNHCTDPKPEGGVMLCDRFNLNFNTFMRLNPKSHHANSACIVDYELLDYASSRFCSSEEPSCFVINDQCALYKQSHSAPSTSSISNTSSPDHENCLQWFSPQFYSLLPAVAVMGFGTGIVMAAGAAYGYYRHKRSSEHRVPLETMELLPLPIMASNAAQTGMELLPLPIMASNAVQTGQD